MCYIFRVLSVTMGKPQKKKNLSDKVRKTKTAADIKNNPFEVKINRQKFEILGRKSKHDIGLPGVSRSKAIKKVRNRRKEDPPVNETFLGWGKIDCQGNKKNTKI